MEIGARAGRGTMKNSGLVTRIAEGIMGWKPAGTAGGYWAPEKGRTQMLYESPLHMARLQLDIDRDHPGDGFCVWFDGNMSDAWNMVERMTILQPPGHAGPAMLHCLRQCAPDWEASFCTDFGIVTGPRCTSAAEALCFAAVQAMRLDEMLKPRAVPEV